ncbi:MAG: site-2 protease family protein [Candidatus Micrarchaeia archaeon]
MNKEVNRSKIKISDILHIKVELHWTFIMLLLFALFISAYSGLYFFVIIVLLFLMVLIHEFAHSATALANNIEVKKIILLPLGGASIIDLDNVKPSISLKIALAGPVMSILLGLLCGIIAIIAPPVMLTQWLGVPVSIVTIFQILFILNILLGIFNLLPAFPLDGGRVMKSALERKHDPFTATKLAVKISNIILVIFIVGSIIYELTIPGMSISYFTFVLIWDLIIVFFIYGGAQSELDMAYIIKYASNIKASTAVSKDYIVVKPYTKMKDLYNQILKKGTHIAVFSSIDNGKLNVYAVAARLPNSSASNYIKQAAMLEKTVSDYKVKIPYINYNAPLSKAIEKMRYEGASIMALVRNNKVVGVLNLQHVESIIALHLPLEIQKDKQRDIQTNK